MFWEEKTKRFFLVGQMLNCCVNIFCWFHVPPLSDKHSSLKVSKGNRVRVIYLLLIYCTKKGHYVDKCKDLKERNVPFSYMCLIGDGGAGKVGLIQPFYAAQIT